MPRDTVTWYRSVDSLFERLSINHNMDSRNQRCGYDNGANLNFFKVYIMVEEIPNFGNVHFEGNNFKGSLLLAEGS